MQHQLIVGDTWDWTVSSTDYLPATGWALTLTLVPRLVTTPPQSPIVLTSTASADGAHRFQRTAVQTSAYIPGRYALNLRAVKGAEVYTIGGVWGTGEIQVWPDPGTAPQSTDTRTVARIALDDALASRNAYIAAGQMTVAEYTIGGRTMKFRTIAELLALISQLQIDVSRERRAAALAAGQPDPRKIYVRAGRVG